MSTSLSTDKQLNIPLTHGDVEHKWHWSLTPFDADEQRYVTSDPQHISALEWFVVLLNVVNVFIYLYEWSGVTTAGVIVIVCSRVAMLGATILLAQNNFNYSLLVRQFSSKNHNRWVNIGIVVNLFVVAIVRLWIQFLSDGQPYGAKTYVYIPYQASYLLPYGYFLLLDAFRRSSHAFRLFVVVVPLTRLLTDWGYYARVTCGDMEELRIWGWSLGYGETYLCASSLAIVAAAAPFVVNVFADETRQRVHLFCVPESRQGVLEKIATEAGR